MLEGNALEFQLLQSPAHRAVSLCCVFPPYLQTLSGVLRDGYEENVVSECVGQARVYHKKVEGIPQLHLLEVKGSGCFLGIDMVMDELEGLTAKGSGKDKAAAKLGLSLLKAKNVSVLKTEKHLNTDKMIVETAKSPDFVVATQDQDLKRALKENNVQIIVLRQKKHLELL